MLLDIERRKGQLAMVAHQADYEQQRATVEATMKEAGASWKSRSAITTRSMARRGMSFKRLGDQIGQAIARPGKNCDERAKSPEIVSRSNEITATRFSQPTSDQGTGRPGKEPHPRTRPPCNRRLEDMEERRKHPRIQGDVGTTYVPGDYDQREQTRVQTSVDNMLRRTPQGGRSTCWPCPRRLPACKPSTRKLLVKAEQCPCEL